MADELIGRVGPTNLPDGSGQVIRMSKTGAVVTSHAHAKYVEAAGRGKLLTVSTAITGVAPGTALSTTPPIALWNPTGSGKNLFVIQTTVAYVSGTIGVGILEYVNGSQPIAAPTTGTELTPKNLKLGSSVGVGRAFTGSTFAAAGTLLQATYSLAPFLATTVTIPPQLKDVVDGMICVAPGTWFGMEAVAGAGTSPLLTYSISWEEVTINE